MWRKLAATDRSGRRALLHCLLASVLVKPLLSFLTFPSAVRALRIALLLAPLPQTPPDAEETRRWADRVYRRLPFRLSCLERSMVLRSVLGRSGIPSRIHVGLRRGETLAAHAWVTAEDLVLAEEPEVARSFESVLTL